MQIAGMLRCSSLDRMAPYIDSHDQTIFMSQVVESGNNKCAQPLTRLWLSRTSWHAEDTETPRSSSDPRNSQQPGFGHTEFFPDTCEHMPPFPYKRLESSRSIRLLQFVNHDEPTCKMITVEVEKAPPYMAPSYTWGEGIFSEKLAVDGHTIPITANLRDAVEATFQSAKNRSLMFWADSVCINQSDIRERGQQVRLMNTIYRCAEVVNVWLGLAADESELAIEVMKEWETEFDRLKREYNGSERLALSNISRTDPIFFGPNGSRQQRAFSAFGKLVCRPWWSRAWIVQEGTIANSSRMFVICGKQFVDWTLFRVAILLSEHAYVVQPYDISPDARMGVAYGSRLKYIRDMRRCGARINLLQILNLMRRHQCQDARDKVYAALGMAMDVQNNDIIPDYTKTYMDVYMDVVKFSIKNPDEDMFNFLSYVTRSTPHVSGYVSSDLLLPSWVPNWAHPTTPLPFQMYLNPDNYGERKKSYQASGNLGGECYIDQTRLYTQGSVVDHITEVSSIFKETFNYKFPRAFSEQRSWALHDTKGTYVTGGTAAEAFNHTLIADLRRGSKEGALHFWRGFAIDWDFLDRDWSQMSPNERSEHSRVLVWVQDITWGRRMFRTSRGLMGLGPAAAQVGDKVCVLLGGHVLYVARGFQDDCYEFVGECYVHGMMDGAAVEEERFSAREMVFV